MTTMTLQLTTTALKAVILLGLTGVSAALLRRRSAAARHTAWTLGMAMVVALPLLATALPRLEVGILPERQIGSQAERQTVNQPGEPAVPSVIRAPATEAVDRSPARESITSSIGARTNERREGATTARGLETWIGFVWLIGVGLGLGWIGLGEVAARRLGSRATPVGDSEWLNLAEEVKGALGVSREIRLVELAVDVVPMTYGWLHPVIVVPRAGRQWPITHQRDVLTHEIAHIARHDCATHLVARVACALHWYNPLAWLAARQARIEREQACDDAVLRSGELPSRYADALLTTAQTMKARVGPAMAGLSMARRSQLADRLFSVLDETRPRAALRPATVFGMAGAALLMAAPIAALLPVQPAPKPARQAPRPPMAAPTPRPAPNVTITAAPPRPSAAPTPPAALVTVDAPVATPVASTWMPGADPAPCLVAQEGARTVRLNSSMSITGEGTASDGTNTYVAWSGRDCSVVIRSNGTVRFTDDETDVASVSRGGRFTITHDEGRSEREYDVRSRDGTLTRRYTVDGETAAEDAAFAQWRAALVLAYIRRTGYDAEGRVRRILAARGVDGVLAEIDEIGSDWAGGKYFKALFQQATLDETAAAKAVARAGQTIESDFELGQVLAALPVRLLESERTREAFVTAAGIMESDFEMRKVLAGVLAAGKPTAELTNAMLGLATQLDSDFELAELLVGLAATGTIPASSEAAYLTATKSIESDFEKHRVLSALLKSGARTPATLRAGLEAAETIDSDFEAASWLKEVAAAGAITDELAPAFFRVVATIESDFEKRGALDAALNQHRIPPNVVRGVLEAAASIDSDFELANLLVAIANRGLAGGDNRPAFRRALATIESSFERQRVYAALGEKTAET